MADLRDGRPQERDRLADERDRLADERDREADERDRLADVCDKEQETAERVVSDGVIDLHERRALTLARHAAAAHRQQAALDRAAAAADRRKALLDRVVAADERDDSFEEREILLRDALTGVLQRRPGLIELEREIARSNRSEERFVVAFIDVDRLKRINDEGGHGAGDEALRTVGEVLRTSMRSYDQALRYGGDEFVCVLPGFGAVEATARFGLLRAELAAGRPSVSVTVGLAEWEPGDDADTLIARADADLYAERRRQRRDGEETTPVVANVDADATVAAHGLLNDSAVVSMGITTLLEGWEGLAEPDRMHLLTRMLSHASTMDERLKEITRGRFCLT